MTATRLVALWCPEWPVVAAALAGEVPVAAPVAVLHAHRVVARSRAAATEGVRVGMRRRESQAACPSLVVVEHDPVRDARWFEPVLRAVGDVAALVEVGAPGRLVFAARGPVRQFGSDDAIAERLAETVDEALGDALGIAGRPGVGVADGRFAAFVAALSGSFSGSPTVVPAGASRSFLAPRPIGLLAGVGDVAPDLVHLLRRLGLTRLGDVAALPPADLLARFGAAGRVVHHLATGVDEMPPSSAPPPLDLAVTQVFDEPVGQVQALVFTARTLAGELTADLLRRGLTCTRLLVEMETDTGERSARCWYRPGGLSAAAMVERVRWQIEGWALGDTPASGVVRLHLVPDEVAADDGVQSGFWGGRTQADDWAGKAVARLSGLLGSDAVLVAEWRGGRDHPFVLVPAATTDLDDRARNIAAPPRSGPWPGRLPAPSPTWVHPSPLPVDVRDADGRVVVVGRRGSVSAAPARVVPRCHDDSPGPVPGRGAGQMSGPVSGRVVGWAGPWPVEEKWWDSRARRVARFQVTVVDARGQMSAHLAEVRDQQWWLVADYA